MRFSSFIAYLDKNWLRITLFAAGVAVIGFLVLGALQKLLTQISYDDLINALEATSRHQFIAALLATVFGYICMIEYDRSAMRYAGVKLKYSTTALTSFVAFSLGNTVGFGALAGSMVRMRLYTAAGLEATQVSKVIGFNVAAFGLGTLTFGALGLLWGAVGVYHLTGFSATTLRVIAAIVVLVVIALIIACIKRREIKILNWKIPLPHWKLALWQLIISAGDIGAAALTLWVLLPTEHLHFASYIAYYTIGLTLGIISHVPGGLGVFEIVILFALGGKVPIEQVAGALLIYRIIYFFIPLALSAVLLVIYSIRFGTMRPLANAAWPLLRAIAQITPVALAALTFIAGLELLISGMTPSIEEATELLSFKVPLVIIESAHLVGSICGLLLLVLAKGLFNRLDAAWWGALIATGISFWLALPKGLAWHEMILLGFLFSLLVLSRKQFDRRSSFFSEMLDPYWIISVIAIIAASAWILFFAYRNVEYSRQLWWSFEFDADAPRSLRAIMAIALITLILAIWQLLRNPSGTPKLPTQDELDKANDIIAKQDMATAGLSLTGDKPLLFSKSGNSFLMYGKQGRSWVALFDPVGDPKERRELIWDFIGLAHDHGGRATFYQVSPLLLSYYLDAGLRAYKLGEFAWVPLAEFSLKGGSRANLRTAVNKAEREGLTFEVVPKEAVAPYIDELKRISDEWLDNNKAKEKGFSLGMFSASYIERFPVAIVRLNNEIIAFASLLETATRREASIDLMRYCADAPSGTMDFLFTKLMFHYQALGTERFGLGMAPLSGMADHELASNWHRVGRLLFGHGERFYHFRGLRSFKEKFNPVWEPRYLAAPGGLAPLFTLADVTTLISRGHTRLFNK